MEDPEEETQITSFVDNLVASLSEAKGQKICNRDEGVVAALSSREIVELFKRNVGGGHCNVNTMVNRLEQQIYTRRDEFEV